MTRMTDEEAARLDEKWTKNPPRPGPNGTGYFTRCKNEAAERGGAKHGGAEAHTITIDSFAANYLSSRAIAAHKTPADIIDEMVQKELAAAM